MHTISFCLYLNSLIENSCQFNLIPFVLDMSLVGKLLRIKPKISLPRNASKKGGVSKPAHLVYSLPSTVTNMNG